MKRVTNLSILSWNIQNGLGVDGLRSLDRIAKTIAAMADPDVICLQEVSRGMVLDAAQPAPDQIAALKQLFPAYEVVFGPALDRWTGLGVQRAQYGNVILSRLPILSIFLHPLPQPAVENLRQMPRQLTEITVDCGEQSLRIMTTHLEFHSSLHRKAQIAAIRAIHQDAVQPALCPPVFDANGPYATLSRGQQAILCGDLNCSPESTNMAELCQAFSEESCHWQDAWKTIGSGRPHLPNCGIHDHQQWPQGPHCRDFFIVSNAISGGLRQQSTDTVSNASDHQPILLDLAFSSAGIAPELQ